MQTKKAFFLAIGVYLNPTKSHKTISDFLEFILKNFATSRKPHKQWVLWRKFGLNLPESLATWVMNPMCIMKNSEKIM